MRLRKKWWARPEIEESEIIVIKPQENKGKWQQVFGGANPIHLELGCGKGGFISQKAVLNKNINYIGMDLKDEVLVFALRKTLEVEVENVRLIPMNISFIGDVFQKDEISKIYINFCNPWPKLRHNKRRLTHTRFLNEYKNFLAPNSEIWFKTDNFNLFEESKEYFKENGFDLKFVTYDLHNSDFKENVMTEYEEKFSSKGMKIMFLLATLK